MSRNAWERGSIKIPSAAWAGLKAAVRTQHNMKQEMGFQLALGLYHHLKEAVKGQRNQSLLLNQMLDDVDHRGFDIPASAAEDKAFDKTKTGPLKYADHRGVRRVIPADHSENYDFWWSVKKAVWTRKTGKLALRKPQKKDFPLATNKTRHFDLGEASITFSSDTEKTVTWNVFENNHAPERAHQHSLAKAFFAALDKIRWTRGSGGEISGNDEYNRDDANVGGGSNYCIAKYGPESNRSVASGPGMIARHSFNRMGGHFRW